jgi:hypothetical protein
MTDQSKHTLGPWCFEAENGKRHPRVYAADNSLVAEVGNNVLVRWEEWDANARLIAAAPNMLRTLQVIHHTLSVHGHIHERIEEAIAEAMGGIEGASATDNGK